MQRSFMRPSLLKLMSVVVATAISVAALRLASPIWADALLTLTPATIGFAILAAVYREGSRRAYWLGFALFGGGYLWLAFGAWPGLPPTPRLLTGRLFAAMYERMSRPPATGRPVPPPVAGRPDPPAPPGQYLEAAYRLVGVNDDLAVKYCRAAFHYRDMLDEQERAQLFENRRLLRAEEITILMAEQNSLAPRTMGTLEDFERTGHCLMGLAAGCFGGILGSSLFNTRRPRYTPEIGMDQV